MKKELLVIVAAISSYAPLQAAMNFIGASRDVITVTPETSTGLNAIYVINDMNGVTAQYTATSDARVTWYRYSNLGGGYAEEITGVSHNGRVYSYQLTGTGDMGYIIEEGTSRTYFWLVDYSQHQLHLSGLDISPEQECDMTSLIPTGEGDKIAYYSITGVPKELDRELELTYSTLEYNSDNDNYSSKTETHTLSYLPATIHAPAPLCDTDFSLSGDRFLRQWGMEQEIVSPTFNTIAVAAETHATQTERDNDNEKKEEGSQMGGSAPAEITFSAATTDAAIYKEWQFSYDQEFNDITTRYNEKEFTYTFTEEGTTYVRFVANNAAGTCEYIGETYEIFIGESRLECPNAFSPGASEGVNDEWKVSYKSIIDFECHIFNRWGVKLASFKDPSQGWDGKYKGKIVPSGVYYYVIKATGSDGKKYNLGGDINVRKSKGNFSSSSGDESQTTE